MAYTKTVWEDFPSTDTPITADRLNNIEDGIEVIDTTKVNTSDIIDTLASTDATKPLSAKQGKVLGDRNTDSGWLDLIYENDWSSFNAGTYDKAQYRKIGTMVYLRGLVTRGNTVNSTTKTIGTLPSGYRPQRITYVPSNNTDTTFMSIVIGTNGTVSVTASIFTASAYVSLNGISFTTD